MRTTNEFPEPTPRPFDKGSATMAATVELGDTRPFPMNAPWLRERAAAVASTPDAGMAAGLWPFASPGTPIFGAKLLPALPFPPTITVAKSGDPW